MAVRSQPRQIVGETLSGKPFIKIGLVEWLKMKALSASPSTAKKKKELKAHMSNTFIPFVAWIPNFQISKNLPPSPSLKVPQYQSRLPPYQPNLPSHGPWETTKPYLYHSII
jgi:hypothetical protein